MPPSDAHRRANRKYNAAHYASLPLRVHKDNKPLIEAAAAAAGESVQAYIRNALAQRMAREQHNAD